jgi:succinoglycan biosynthesis protein ExoM
MLGRPPLGRMSGDDPPLGRMSGDDPPLRLAVCACTYLRPKGLARLLDGLARLEVPDGVRVEIVVVDNDPAASGRPVVEAARPQLPFALRYEVEPERGIVAARNAAVAAADGADAVAFLDDDEWPSPGWLAELLRVAEATGAEVVAGAVEPVFDEEPPAWVREGGFFHRRRHPDGARITYARTSNALVGAAALQAHAPPFRDTGSDGGEDTWFFHRVHLEGRPIVWADRATVYEAVPPSRVAARWLILRQYRYGLTRSAVLRSLEGSPWRVARRAALGLFTVLRGLVLLLASVRGGKAAAVRAAATVASGVGLVLGLAGVGHDQYRRVHGS